MRIPTFRGSASSFRTPGRAGTAGQKILSLFNAVGSTTSVIVEELYVDLAMTVVKAVTVLPPIVRVWKVVAAPTDGTVLTKNQLGGYGAPDAAVVVRGDASADSTGSAVALAATLPPGAIIEQEFAARFITAAGYEMADRLRFLAKGEVFLKAAEGLVVFLDYTLATQNPTTDMWVAGARWTEG